MTNSQEKGFDPMEASSDEVVPWLIKRSEESSPPLKVQKDLEHFGVGGIMLVSHLITFLLRLQLERVCSRFWSIKI